MSLNKNFSSMAIGSAAPASSMKKSTKKRQMGVAFAPSQDNEVIAIEARTPEEKAAAPAKNVVKHKQEAANRVAREKESALSKAERKLSKASVEDTEGPASRSKSVSDGKKKSRKTDIDVEDYERKYRKESVSRQESVSHSSMRTLYSESSLVDADGPCSTKPSKSQAQSSTRAASTAHRSSEKPSSSGDTLPNMKTVSHSFGQENVGKRFEHKGKMWRVERVAGTGGERQG